jgi:hypothetical protein
MAHCYWISGTHGAGFDTKGGIGRKMDNENQAVES